MSNTQIRKALNPTMILRFGAGFCFIGHGALALGAKAKFIALLGSFGIDPALAIMILKGVGCLDIAIGLFILIRPNKLVLQWAMIWTGLTILAWGIHGDSLMDLFRRTVYLTTPMALILMLYGKEVSKAKTNPSVLEDEDLTKKHKLPVRSMPIVSAKEENAIDNLDLSMICMKLMDPTDGEGWSKRQCDEVALEYRRYLKLNLLYPKANIVPNLAIDTLWHYHILDTEAYYRDCQAIFGHILHHYPYFGMQGRADAKQFVSAFDRTKMLYKKTFSTSMDGPNYLLSFKV